MESRDHRGVSFLFVSLDGFPLPPLKETAAPETHKLEGLLQTLVRQTKYSGGVLYVGVGNRAEMCHNISVSYQPISIIIEYSS